MDGHIPWAHDLYMKHKRRLYLREWRKHRGLTLEQLADRVGMTHSSLSRIERGLQRYDQELLERAADALQCEEVDLLIRDPLAPESIWSIWDKAQPGQRRQIVEIAAALLKTGT